MRRRIALVLIAAAAAARAEAPVDDPDTDAARHHFRLGEALYAEGKYREAMREFETAYSIAPRPAFTFNVARCWERLEEWARAADTYDRFLAAAPTDPEAENVRARVVTLRERTARIAPAAAPPVTAVARRSRAPAIAVALLAVAALGGGGALLGVSLDEFSSLRASCGNYCMRSQWASGPPLEYGGVAALAVGGVLLAIDVMLWVVARR
jgi:tetratricopeptide (TPR) repeat protein